MGPGLRRRALRFCSNLPPSVSHVGYFSSENWLKTGYGNASRYDILSAASFHFLDKQTQIQKYAGLRRVVATYSFIIFALVGCRLFGQSHGARNHFLFGFCLWAISMWAALRYKVGCDWSNYFRYFDSVPEDFWEIFSYRDPLFHVVVWVIKNTGFELYPAINVVTSLFFIAGVSAFSKHISDKLAFLYYLFPVFVMGLVMSGIRQAIAASLMMIAFSSFIRAKPNQALVWVLVAGSFHSSALIFIIIWPLSLRINRKKKIVLFALCFFPAALGLLSTEAAELAQSRYVGTDVVAAGAIFRILLLSIAAAVFFLVMNEGWKKLRPDTFDLVRYTSFSIFGLLGLAGLSTVLADRLAYYFIPIIAMVQSDGPFVLPSRGLVQAFSMAFLSIYLIFFLYWMASSRHFNGCYVPYQWIF